LELSWLEFMVVLGVVKFILGRFKTISVTDVKNVDDS
jgi:hypothetical protein